MKTMRENDAFFSVLVTVILVIMFILVVVSIILSVSNGG